MSLQLNGDTGVTFNDASLQGAAASPFGLKNRIINGDMRIDQRNAGASVTVLTTTGYTLDRWNLEVSQSSKLSVQQNAGSVTPPAGFKNYLGITSLSAYSIGSGDYFALRHLIEGFNIADLAWGTADAKTITLSFWVRSSLTGTFGGGLKNGTSNYNYPFSYTISSANTWEQKSITISGATSGTWSTDSGLGVQVYLGLGVGSTYSATAGTWITTNVVSTTGATSVVGTNGATFYITGVQLEVGSTATPFERRLYGTELQLCQRYFYKTFSPATAVANATSYTTGIGVPDGTAYSTGAIRYNVMFPQPLRTTPTMTYYSVGGLGTVGSGLYQFFGGGNWTAATNTGTGEVSDMYVGVEIAKTSSMTTGYSYLLGGQFTASAEL
jgi:hypothetical protein